MLDAYAIGTPAHMYHPGANDKCGYVAEVKAGRANVYSLGSGSMVLETAQLVIAWDDLTFSEVSDSIAAPWFDRAARAKLEPIAAADALDLLARAKAETARKRAEAVAETQAAHKRMEARRATYRDKIPADAQAVIVAQMMRDDSDVQSDYFHASVQKTVILAFSSHTRDLFSEMRKAARNFAETADLADAPASAENRCKWSMGQGYFLQIGGSYCSGWRIRKERFYGRPGENDRAAMLPHFDVWSVPEAAPEPTAKPAPEPTASVEPADGISQHVHDKKGFTFYIVQLSDRVSREHFDKLLTAAKARGGWYSRAWGKTPAGFAFKDHAAAVAFKGAL